MLTLTVAHRLANGGIAATRAVRTLQCLGQRHVGEDRGHALEILHEAHVIVPLVVDAEGLHTVPYWMLLCLKVWGPVRVHRPIEITETAHPLEELVARVALDRLGGPVDHHHADALFHKRIELL